MDYPFSEDELWVLRWIDKHTRVPGQTFQVPRNNADDPLAKEILERMSLDDFDSYAVSLRDQELVHFGRDSSYFKVSISHEGRHVIHRIDNPDLVEQAIHRARRHPVLAKILLAHILFGALAGWLAFVLSLIHTFRCPT